MAWESIILKVPDSSNFGRLHHHKCQCPKCEGTPFTIPYQVEGDKRDISKKLSDNEKEFLVLICDRCGQFIAFEGCKGECASLPRSKCEVCGKYYCMNCGISVDMEVYEKQVELRYCNDHIPEWYKNR